MAREASEPVANTGEASQGFLLWHRLTRVISLSVNIRAPGVLGRLQTEMRAGQIGEEMRAEEAAAESSGKRGSVGGGLPLARFESSTEV